MNKQKSQQSKIGHHPIDPTAKRPVAILTDALQSCLHGYEFPSFSGLKKMHIDSAVQHLQLFFNSGP